MHVIPKFAAVPIEHPSKIGRRAAAVISAQLSSAEIPVSIRSTTTDTLLVTGVANRINKTPAPSDVRIRAKLIELGYTPKES